jgi:hypothetical protein
VCDFGAQDCFYANCTDVDLGWGYSASATTACHGWGSLRDPTAGCENPRLDRDNVTCNKAQPDPLAVDFCGPENINLDNPKNDDKFVVGVNHYGNHGGTANAKPHVNIYCNGSRVLSVGYNPATGQTQFPLLNRGGSNTSGDFWNAVVVTAHVTAGTLSSCTVETVPSHHADPGRDGTASTAGAGNDICVESKMNASTPAYSYKTHQFVDTGSAQGIAAGSQPTTAAQFCKH